MLIEQFVDEGLDNSSYLMGSEETGLACQTIFGVPDEMSGQTLEVELVCDGYGDGAFVVLSAKKTS